MLTTSPLQPHDCTHLLQDWQPRMAGMRLPGYIALFGVTADTPEATIQHLIRSLVPQKPTRKRGRPRETTRLIPRDQFHHAYVAKYCTLSARCGKRPTHYTLAAELGISVPTLRRYLREYGKPYVGNC